MKKIILALCLGILIFGMMGIVSAQENGDAATCVGEGESLGAVVPENTKECCSGLEPYVPERIVGTRGTCVAITATTCIEGFIKKYTCPDGLQVDWCTCTNGNFVCIISPELKCNTGEIKEQVKCLFAGSTQLQKCYTAEQNSRAYCSGTDACVADISGYKGEKITWKSTCGGYAYTIIDGENEYAKFDCNNIGVCQPSKCDDGTMTSCAINMGNGQCICSTCPPIIIKPVCGNGICESGEGEICSATEVMCEIGKECKTPPAECFVACPQDCKTTDGIYANLNEKFKLQISQPVKIMDNSGEHVLKITFRDLITSKCAETPISYEASQTIASKVAVATTGTAAMTATGNAIAPAETETTIGTTTSTTEGGGGTIELLKCIGSGPIAVLYVDTIVDGQLGKNYVLNLNAKEKKQVGEFTVTFLDYDYASRSGIFLVSRETSLCPEKCKCDENGKIIDCAEECEIGKTLCPDGVCRDKCSIIVDDCKYGCSYDGKCFPIGVRSSGLFCGVDLNMNSQLKSESICDNSFECSSNVCVSGKCIDEGLIQKILNWFGKLFGGK